MKTTIATKYLEVRTSTGPEAVIAVRGELDLASMPTFRAAVRDLDVSHRRRVVLDLRRLSFIDAAGLHAVLDLHDECEEVSAALTILPGPRPVQRVFELSGADEFLPVTGGKDHASAAAGDEAGPDGFHATGPAQGQQETDERRRKDGSR